MTEFSALVRGCGCCWWHHTSHCTVDEFFIFVLSVW